MGRNFQRRGRMEDLRDVPEMVLPSIGENDWPSAKFDYQIVADEVNRRLDEAQERIDSQ